MTTTVRRECDIYISNNEPQEYCPQKPETIRHYGYGDGTVPTLSAGRYNGVTDLAPAAHNFLFRSPSNSKNSDYEHNGIPSNPDIEQLVFSILNDKAPDAPPRGLPYQPVTSQQIAHAETTNELPDYYLVISGGESITIYDGEGHSTEVITGALRSKVPNVVMEPIGERDEQLIIPSAGVYTVTFDTTGEPMGIEITSGTNDDVGRVIRYHDVSLPVSERDVGHFRDDGDSAAL